MKADWFRHDTDAHADVKLCTVLAERGPEGYGLFFLLVEVLTKESAQELRFSLLPGLAMKFNCPADKLRAFIDYFVELGLLQSDGTKFWSDAHKTRMEALATKREEVRSRVARVRSVTPQNVTKLESVTSAHVTKPPSVTVENVTQGTERYTSNLIYSNSNQIKSNSNPEPPPERVPEPKPPPATADPYEKFRKHVDKFLRVPTEPPEPWQQNNLFVTAGKRPCVMAEHVWLTPQQLVEIFKLYADTAGKGAAEELFFDALRKTQADAQAHVDQGRPLASFKAYNHLTSWKLQDAANTRAALSRMTNTLAKELSR